MPLLHQQQGKSSLEWENARHVSGQTPDRLWAGQRAAHLLLLPCTDSPKQLTKCRLRAPRRTGASKAFDFQDGIKGVLMPITWAPFSPAPHPDTLNPGTERGCEHPLSAFGPPPLSGPLLVCVRRVLLLSTRGPVWEVT